MPRIKYCIALALVTLLSACQPPSTWPTSPYQAERSNTQANVPLLPYKFELADFSDERSYADYEQKLPFDSDQFMQALQGKVSYQLFGTPTAYIDVTLNEYTITENNGQYAISMVTALKAVNVQQRVLAADTYMCAAISQQQFELHNILRDMVNNPKAFTKSSREAKLLDNMFKDCVGQIARDFAASLNQQRVAHEER